MTGTRERISPGYFERRLRIGQSAGQLDRSASGERMPGRGVGVRQQDGLLGVWLWYELTQLLERKPAGQAQEPKGRVDLSGTPAAEGMDRQSLKTIRDPRLAAEIIADLMNKTQAAVAKTEQIAALVAGKQRAAYRSRDSVSLFRLRGLSTSISDLCLDLAAAIGGLSDLKQDLAPAQRSGAHFGDIWLGPSAEDRSAVQVGWLPCLQPFDKVFASIQRVHGCTSPSRNEKAGSETEPGPNIVAAEVSSFGSLAQAADAICRAFDAAIGPMVAECDRILSNLDEIEPDEKKAALALGSYDQVSWDREAGGRELFDYMRVVMAAKSSNDVPIPVPPRVATYFVKHRVRIEAGVSGSMEGDKVPTTGAWFLRRADREKLAAWIFSHRRQLWAIFYGNTRRPDKG
jgi:hypothetical protein